MEAFGYPQWARPATGEDSRLRLALRAHI
jgi:hypothetical protein